MTRNDDETWDEERITINGFSIRNTSLVDYQGNPLILYQRSSSPDIYWAMSTDGASWSGTRIDSASAISVPNATIINGRPGVVYTVGDGVTEPYSIKYARFINTTKWEITFVHSNMIIPDDYTGGDPSGGLKALAEYRSQVFIFPSINTMRVYTPSELNVLNGISSTYYCECGSNIFDIDQRLLPLSEMGRWESSAHGYSDTRVTDSFKNSMRPNISSRRRGSAVISFEDDNEVVTEIKQSTFQSGRDSELLGSGTRSWFDFRNQVPGKNVATSVDINNFVSSAYEREDAEQDSNIPTDSIYVDSFEINDSVSSVVSATIDPEDTTCDITKLTDNVLTTDPFLSKHLVKKIALKEKYVDYFTYTSGNQVAPVVSVCDVELDIWGTPEVTAVRIKNEDQEEWGKWCPWKPEKGDYHMEITHKLSLGAGNKEICIQAITYDGITAQFCIPVIADYRKIFFELRMYSDDEYSIPLPKHDGLFVAALDPVPGSGGIAETRTMYIEIIPNEPVVQIGGGCGDDLASSINFDVLQQGVRDNLDLTATWDCSGAQIFRGSFDIFKEDNVTDIDGLARLRVRIPGECDEPTSSGFFVASEFIRDTYNRMSDTSQAAITEEEGDVFESYRQEVSGRVGTGVVLRPSNDPYLVFGNPDYFLKKDDPEQKGIQEIEEE